MEIGQFALALVGHFLASLLYVLQRLHIVEAVDTSSILEHREELRELWEKRMMADDNQSSSPSIMAENTNSKPLPEGETEEKVAKSDSEPNTQHKMPNGFTHPVDNKAPDGNANHIVECNENIIKESVVKESLEIDADLENNNSADSLEEDNNDYVEEKTYTSTLEQALIMSEIKEVKSITSITTTVEEVHEVKEAVQTLEQEIVIIKSEEKQVQNVTTAECVETNISATVAEEHTTVIQSKTEEKVETQGNVKEVSSIEDNVVPTAVEKAIIQDYQEKFESLSEKMVLPVVSPIEDEDDGFIPLEECLPKDDNAEEEVDLPGEHFEQSSDEPSPSSNGFGDHLLISPIEPQSTEKAHHAEIEQFVKAGGVKRIIPGVQKTEQPYNTCTTETKIAMEIREMREREEELRIMRERASMSPAASPVPPKTPSTPSIASPSPSPKEGPSPIPQGPGYRVSSVFGHKGAISPSLSHDEDRKLFKNFTNKESAVEKEIRLAKDREEELRKQKGLPPREDDSYVKPSQVKSSQVRVFGKMVGSNVKQAATAKIQLEIEEQTQREMALRETGSIQTISQERTDAKVAKLKPAENNSTHVHTNGNSHPPVNGTHTNGYSSPDSGAPYKRSSPSPTNARPASIFAHNNGMSKGNISMHKFINSKGKETAFTAPRNGPFSQREETLSKPVVPPTMVNLKRTVSVESKIQQEIMEMKQREEELKKLHLKMINGESETVQNGENGTEHEMNHKNTLENENGNGIADEELSPRHNKLIAQWEQRIQKAES